MRHRTRRLPPQLGRRPPRGRLRGVRRRLRPAADRIPTLFALLFLSDDAELRALQVFSRSVTVQILQGQRLHVAPRPPFARLVRTVLIVPQNHLVFVELKIVQVGRRDLTQRVALLQFRPVVFALGRVGALLRLAGVVRGVPIQLLGLNGTLLVLVVRDPNELHQFVDVGDDVAAVPLDVLGVADDDVLVGLEFLLFRFDGRLVQGVAVLVDFLKTGAIKSRSLQSRCYLGVVGNPQGAGAVRSDDWGDRLGAGAVLAFAGLIKLWERNGAVHFI